MKTYAGIDLHSSNNYIGIIDAKDKRLYSKRHNNRIEDVLKVLGKFKASLQGVVVESTYNWYWLVDGLMDQGYTVHLANPNAIQSYDGLKHTDDKWDSFWLAHLLRLGILPEGYIYPKHQRPIRDMLRRRLMFVRQRTSQILSLQSMATRNRGLNFSGAQVKRFRDEFIEKMFSDPNLVFTAKRNIATIRFLDRIVGEIEREVASQIKLKKKVYQIADHTGYRKYSGADHYAGSRRYSPV
jgi:transposase